MVPIHQVDSEILAMAILQIAVEIYYSESQYQTEEPEC